MPTMQTPLWSSSVGKQTHRMKTCCSVRPGCNLWSPRLSRC
jgi:hypothetical protein